MGNLYAAAQALRVYIYIYIYIGVEMVGKAEYESRFLLINEEKWRNTVDGCEILHHLGWNLEITEKNHLSDNTYPSSHIPYFNESILPIIGIWELSSGKLT